MTWIKTVTVDESEEVRKAVESQRELYPIEYATPVHPTPDGEDDYRKAPISEQERVMLDYVVQITRDATRISPADHERLRSAGFDDKGILQITLIASWFNYINRVADALGVGRD
jgi:alkylhydroperoxidase family enzyme